MSSVAEARAEAVRLWNDEGLDVARIAQRMGRSVEGAGLLLKYAGVDLDAPRKQVATPVAELSLIELPDPAGETIPSSQGNARAAEVVTGDSPVASAAPTKARRPPSVVTDAGRFVRMRAINPDIVRWSRQQQARGADLEFVAWCFDVDAQALAEAVAL